MSKFFFESRSLRDNVQCFIQCHNYKLPFIIKKTVFLKYHAFLCEANTFIHIVFFNTFDKIGVFVRTINLFIHLASEFINDSFGFFSKQPKLYSSHGCTLHESCN